MSCIRGCFRVGLSVAVLASSTLSWSCTKSDHLTEPATTSVPSAIVIFPPVQIFDQAGQSLQFSVRVQDQNGFSLTWVPVTWESSDEGVVTVSHSGFVTAVSPGEAEVRVVAKQGTLQARSQVTVR